MTHALPNTRFLDAEFYRIAPKGAKRSADDSENRTGCVAVSTTIHVTSDVVAMTLRWCVIEFPVLAYAVLELHTGYTPIIQYQLRAGDELAKPMTVA